jgi:hypothetical protein
MVGGGELLHGSRLPAGEHAVLVDQRTRRLARTKGYEKNPVVSTPTVVTLNSEPIRLTFDASKALWGPRYAHFVDLWVAYRYWQNKFGLDHNRSASCLFKGSSNNSCTELTVYAGVTMKF